MKVTIYPRNDGSDFLGRYYTNSNVSRFLVGQMNAVSARCILDLGVGDGSLSIAALDQWTPAELLTVDVDREVSSILRNKLRGPNSKIKHSHVQSDALSPRLPALLAESLGKIDVAVCNPPFIISQWRKGFGEILEEAGFSGCIPQIRTVDAALLFLSQNMRLLSDNATLGIIVPDSLVSSIKYRAFRQQLIEKYHLQRVIRLPRNSFANTDALAYVLIISKRVSVSTSVELYRLETDHSITAPLEVSVDGAIDRLDYDFHADSRSASLYNGNSIALSAVSVGIKRGSLSSSQIRQASFPVFHTSDITTNRIGKWCDLRGFGSKKNLDLPSRANLVFAAPGDILIARVGRDLESKIIGVRYGFPVISDCILRVQVPKDKSQDVLDQLASRSGQAWLASRAHGVAAKLLAKRDLLDFPLEVSSLEKI